MGYAAEKEKVEKRINKIKRIAFLAVAVLVLAACVFSAFVPPETWKYYVWYPNVSARGKTDLRVHFIDVGQGDCTLIELPDGKVMLVDGGDDTDGNVTAVMRYLNALGIDEIDYLLLTHADADHCGGLKTVLKYKKVKRAFLPDVPKTTSATYAAVFSAIDDSDCDWEYSRRNIDLSVDGLYTLCFLYPYTRTAENGESDDNEQSAVVWLDYHGTSVLLTGDSTLKTEETLMRDDGLGSFENRSVKLSETEILKVPHHGASDATSEEFVEYLHAEHAVISCGENNAYNHPSDKVQNTLRTSGVEIYRTDKHGHVIVTAKQSGEYAFTKLGK